MAERTQAQRDERRKKIINRTGQVLNGVAITGGAHALMMAGRDKRLSESKNRGVRALAKPYQAYSKLPGANRIAPGSKFATRFAAPLAVGSVGLHTAEVVGDGIAGQALHRQGKQLEGKPVKKSDDINEVYDGPARRGDGIGKALNFDQAPRQRVDRSNAARRTTDAAALGAVGAGVYTGKQVSNLNRSANEVLKYPLQQVRTDKKGKPIKTKSGKDSMRTVRTGTPDTPLGQARTQVKRVLGNPEGTRSLRGKDRKPNLTRAMFDSARTNTRGGAEAVDRELPKFKAARTKGKVGLAATGLLGTSAVAGYAANRRNRWT